MTLNLNFKCKVSEIHVSIPQRKELLFQQKKIHSVIKVRLISLNCLTHPIELKSFQMNCSLPWDSLGAVVVNKKNKLAEREFKAFFKLNFCVVDYVWKKLRSSFFCSPVHFLWTLFFLKSKNPNDKINAATMQTDKKTFRIHVISTLRKLLQALPEVFCYIFIQFIINF